MTTRKTTAQTNLITSAAEAKDFEPIAFFESLRERWPEASNQELFLIRDLAEAYRLAKVELAKSGLFVKANNGTGKFTSPAIKLSIELARTIAKLVSELNRNASKPSSRDSETAKIEKFLKGWEASEQEQPSNKNKTH